MSIFLMIFLAKRARIEILIAITDGEKMENETGENSSNVILGAKVTSACNNFISDNLTELLDGVKIDTSILTPLITFVFC